MRKGKYLLIKYSLLLLCCFTISNVNAQFNFTEFNVSPFSPRYLNQQKNNIDIDYFHNYISLSSEAFYATNSINYNFIKNIYQSKFLSPEIKQKTWDGLKNENNLAGYDFNVKLFANFAAKKNHISYFLAFENHNYGLLQFNKNLFELVFFGNRNQVGNLLSLDKQSFALLKFQQLKVGITKTWLKPHKAHIIIAGLGINNGQQILSFKIPRATFFTHQQAEQIDLNLLMDMHRSDSTQSGFGAENGLGLSIDFSYIYRNARNIFSIGIEDFGFIRWNRYSQHYHKDTSIQFEGFEILNIFDNSQSQITTLTEDSITNEFANARSHDAFSKMIPANIYVAYTRQFCRKKISINAQISKYLFLKSNLLFKVQPAYRISIKKSHIDIMASAQYGGFGGFDMGAGIAASINGSLYFSIKSDYLYSMFNGKNAAGAGIQFNLIKTL